MALIVWCILVFVVIVLLMIRDVAQDKTLTTITKLFLIVGFLVEVLILIIFG